MRRILWPLAFGILGTLILVGLGIWQIARLEAKEAMLAEIAARIAAPPGPLPPRPDPAADRFRPVTARGAFAEGGLLVISSHRAMGAGYRLVSVFVTEDGRRILVDRGFLSEAERALPRPAGRAAIEGNLVWPRESDSYTPAPDAKTGVWFARDVPAMAARLATEPVMIVLRRTDEMTPAALPMPVDTGTIPNDHLQYAITWFLLAAVWAGMTLFYLWRIRRLPDGAG